MLSPSSMARWAGATGFGIGSQLYAPGADAEAVRVKALEYFGAWKKRDKAPNRLKPHAYKPDKPHPPPPPA